MQRAGGGALQRTFSEVAGMSPFELHLPGTSGYGQLSAFSCSALTTNFGSSNLGKLHFDASIGEQMVAPHPCFSIAWTMFSSSRNLNIAPPNPPNPVPWTMFASSRNLNIPPHPTKRVQHKKLAKYQRASRYQCATAIYKHRPERTIVKCMNTYRVHTVGA